MQDTHTILGSAAWGFRELALPEQLRLSKALGFETHELGIANAETDLPLEATAEQLAQVKALYDEYGLKLLCAATGDDLTSEDPAEVCRQLDKLLQVVELCSVLGVKLLRIFAGFTTLEEMNAARWRNLETALPVLTAAAEEKGITLCIETHGAVEPYFDGIRHIRSSTTQTAELKRLLKVCGGKVKLVFDPANLSAVGETELMAFWQEVSADTGYIHLKDFRLGKQGELYPCALGDGKTQWQALVPALAESGLPVLFEYELPEDLEGGLVRCLDSWKSLLNV